MAGPDRSQFERIYNAALEHAPERRAEFVRAECAGDDELRREVESLLAYDGAGLSQLDGPPRVGLPAGSRLGPYEVVGWAGAGGMGEVYKARDTRLNRTVAIKVLPGHLSANADFRLRLEREAKAVSALTHAHVCALYDVGRQDGIDYLVMEFLEGETLAARLAKGALPLKDVLRYGFEIAEALAAAHRCGILHRDLKPGNIMLTKSGAKLLDFGLAKIPDALSETTSRTEFTQTGTLLGTLPYMSPEHVQGKALDFRSDIFSFGAVLYEMAAGHAPFAADSRAGVIAAVLDREPEPPSKTHANIPPALDKLIQSCLIKDREERQQNMHDVAQTIGWIEAAEAAPVAARYRSPTRMPWWIAATLAVAALAVPFLHFRNGPADLRPMRFQIFGPPNAAYSDFDLPALSPDGRLLVFPAEVAGANRVLWLRSMDRMTLQPLAGTEGARFPFWSTDGRYVAFFADDKLKKVDLTGSPPQALCDVVSGAGGSWGPDGTILFASSAGGLWSSTASNPLRRISALGGAPQNVLRIDTSRRETGHSWPQFLPDGRRFLYFSQNADVEKSGMRAGSLDSAETRPVLTTQSRTSFAPPGYLMFAQHGVLMAQPFNASKLQLSGNPLQVAEAVGRPHILSSLAIFSVSNNGVLLWRSGVNPTARIASYARDGKPLGPVGEDRQLGQFNLSPDEKRLAVEIRDTTGNMNIWTIEIASGIFSRVTSGTARNTDPTWSPDGRELAFASSRKVNISNLYRKRVGGAPEEVLLESGEANFPTQWLHDGSILFILNGGRKLYRLPLAGARKPELLFQTEFDTDQPTVSPDGRWIAYDATDSGRWEVYVASFPGFTERRLISTNGGVQPLWAKHGKELFYLSLNGKMMVVDVKAAAAMETGLPRELFAVPLNPNPVFNQYAVTSDGRKFFVLEYQNQAPQPMNVMLNWTAALPH